ncbi:hypothetical protein MUG91_G10n180 [Manis pentadactyla]|nr:hypothetical protein MUG91_G10n180 [Manis pentadactyla]
MLEPLTSQLLSSYERPWEHCSFPSVRWWVPATQPGRMLSVTDLSERANALAEADCAWLLALGDQRGIITIQNSAFEKPGPNYTVTFRKLGIKL